MKYLKIPKERVGVLIGSDGETKKTIEDISNTKIEVDSEAGEICIDDTDTDKPLQALKTNDVITAIGRGFSPKRALPLFDDDKYLLVFNLRDYVGNNASHVHRLKGRVIGKNGRTRKTIEEITKASISVYGHTVAVIVDLDMMDAIKQAMDMLLSGSKHATVYRYLERKRRETKSMF